MELPLRPIQKGEMSEWFKEHAWKVCIRQKCIRGSNPRLSAKPAEVVNFGGLLVGVLFLYGEMAELV